MKPTARSLSLLLYGAMGGYLAISLSGVFGVHTPMPGEVLRTGVFAALAAACAAFETFRVVSWGRASGLVDLLSLKRLLHGGLALLSLGICLSFFFRYERQIVLAEGQVFDSRVPSDPAEIVYRGTFAAVPSPVTLLLVEAAPRYYRNRYDYYYLKTGFLMGQGSEPPQSIAIYDIVPRLVGLFLFYQAVDFGYAPLHRIQENNGNIYSEAYVYMNLSSPLSEDSFRVFTLPHTFYVRYYEDPGMIADPVYRSGGGDGPVFGLRVANNIALQYRGYVRLGEKVYMDGFAFSFEDVRKWVRIRITSDPGLWPMFLGGVLAVTASVVLVWRKL